MKQVIKHKDVGLLNMISRTDPVIQKTVSLQSINYYIISTMNRKYILVLLICVSCSIHAMAQTDYYYYRGKKIPLTLNESKVGISIPKDCDETSKRVHVLTEGLSPCECNALTGKRETMIRMKEKTYTLDTSGFTSGLYVIRVIAGDEICYDKIIIR